jgi:hypothetical protein
VLDEKTVATRATAGVRGAEGGGVRRRDPLPAATRRLAGGLLLLDVLLLLANVAHLMSGDLGEADRFLLASPVWDGAGDGSLVELVGHVQLGLAAAALLVASARRTGVLTAWAVVLLAVAADDLLMLHERGGTWVVHRFGLRDAVGLRAQDVGELSVWALLAGVLGPLLLLAHLRSCGADRAVSSGLVALVAALAAFAVVLDMVGIVVAPHVLSVVAEAVAFAETAGELLVTTAVLVLAHATAVSRRGT